GKARNHPAGTTRPAFPSRNPLQGQAGPSATGRRHRVQPRSLVHGGGPRRAGAEPLRAGGAGGRRAMMTCPYGFWIVGATSGARRLVMAAAALAGYAACDETAETHREAYLSAFSFGKDFLERDDPWRDVDTKGFSGPCGASWLWWENRTGPTIPSAP